MSDDIEAAVSAAFASAADASKDGASIDAVAEIFWKEARARLPGVPDDAIEAAMQSRGACAQKEAEFASVLRRLGERLGAAPNETVSALVARGVILGDPVALALASNIANVALGSGDNLDFVLNLAREAEGQTGGHTKMQQLTAEEIELIELLRGSDHAGDFTLTVSRSGGHVAVGLKIPKHAEPGQGDGPTFAEAWARLAPYWA